MTTRPLVLKTPKGDRVIGLRQPCFIVAEMSANHQQDFATAAAIVRAAAKAGADAVKLQTYTPDTMTIDSPKKWFLAGGPDNPESWGGKTLYELYKQAYTPWEWHAPLKELAENLGLVFFSTPFDATAVDFLAKLGVPCYKIASYEVTDIPLLKKVASTGKPVIMSIGFASLEEVELALQTLRQFGSGEIALLHCVTEYADTANPTSMNLAMIADIRERFGVVSGFSDNNGGLATPIAAARLVASIIEKHFTLDRRSNSFDARFSLEPAEFKQMVDEIRKNASGGAVEALDPLLLGQVQYGPASEVERGNIKYRRSLFMVKDIKKGERFTSDNVRSIRPGYGLPPKHYEEILGKIAAKDIERGTPFNLDLITNNKSST